MPEMTLDPRLLTALIGAPVAGLLGVMAIGFTAVRWLVSRIDKAQERNDQAIRDAQKANEEAHAGIVQRIEAAQAENRQAHAETRERFEAARAETRQWFEAAQAETRQRIDALSKDVHTLTGKTEALLASARQDRPQARTQ